MPKVALFRSEDNLSYYENYTKYLVPAVTEWIEVTDKELADITAAVGYHNKSRSHQGWLVLINELDLSEELPVLIKNVKEFKDKLERDKALAEKKAAEAKAKRDAKSLERKQKQLEKLKKELEGETN